MKVFELIKKARRLGPVLGIKKLAGYEAVFSWGVRKRIRGQELYKEKGTEAPFRVFRIQRIIGMRIPCCASMKTVRLCSWSAWTEEPISDPLGMSI